MTKKDGTNRYKCVISAEQTSWPLTVGQKSRKVIFARLFSVINHSVQLIAHPGSKKGEKNKKNKTKQKTKNSPHLNGFRRNLNTYIRSLPMQSA